MFSVKCMSKKCVNMSFQRGTICYLLATCTSSTWNILLYMCNFRYDGLSYMSGTWLTFDSMPNFQGWHLSFYMPGLLRKARSSPTKTKEPWLSWIWSIIATLHNLTPNKPNLERKLRFQLSTFDFSGSKLYPRITPTPIIVKKWKFSSGVPSSMTINAGGLFATWFGGVDPMYTPPKLTACPWKMMGWKTSLSFWEGTFSGANC